MGRVERRVVKVARRPVHRETARDDPGFLTERLETREATAIGALRTMQGAVRVAASFNMCRRRENGESSFRNVNQPSNPNSTRRLFYDSKAYLNIH